MRSAQARLARPSHLSGLVITKSTQSVVFFRCCSPSHRETFRKFQIKVCVGLVVIIKERQTDLTWMFHCIQSSCAPGAGTSVMVKGGMYIHELERIPKDGFTCIQLKRNSAILPRSADTTSPPFLVRKITIGDIHFYISILAVHI